MAETIGGANPFLGLAGLVPGLFGGLLGGGSSSSSSGGQSIDQSQGTPTLFGGVSNNQPGTPQNSITLDPQMAALSANANAKSGGGFSLFGLGGSSSSSSSSANTNSNQNENVAQSNPFNNQNESLTNIWIQPNPGPSEALGQVLAPVPQAKFPESNLQQPGPLQFPTVSRGYQPPPMTAPGGGMGPYSQLLGTGGGGAAPYMFPPQAPQNAQTAPLGPSIGSDNGGGAPSPADNIYGHLASLLGGGGGGNAYGAPTFAAGQFIPDSDQPTVAQALGTPTFQRGSILGSGGNPPSAGGQGAPSPAPTRPAVNGNRIVRPAQNNLVPPPPPYTPQQALQDTATALGDKVPGEDEEQEFVSNVRVRNSQLNKIISDFGTQLDGMVKADKAQLQRDLDKLESESDNARARYKEAQAQYDDFIDAESKGSRGIVPQITPTDERQIINRAMQNAMSILDPAERLALQQAYSRSGGNQGILERAARGFVRGLGNQAYNPFMGRPPATTAPAAARTPLWVRAYGKYQQATQFFISHGLQAKAQANAAAVQLAGKDKTAYANALKEKLEDSRKNVKDLSDRATKIIDQHRKAMNSTRLMLKAQADEEISKTRVMNTAELNAAHVLLKGQEYVHRVQHDQIIDDFHNRMADVAEGNLDVARARQTTNENKYNVENEREQQLKPVRQNQAEFYKQAANRAKAEAGSYNREGGGFTKDQGVANLIRKNPRLSQEQAEQLWDDMHSGE